ncbi:MAG: hypothetical protein ABEJ83_01895 [Candidatus Nanohaloarchaea archaeon]
MLLTLDTNIIIYTALDHTKDERYATEFNEQTSKFLTQQVYTEALQLEERITMFQTLLKSHREQGESPQETFDRVGEKVKPEMKSRLHRYFSNIVSYYEEQFNRDRTIQEITDSIIYDLSNYTNLDDRIRPASDVLRSSEDKITQYQKALNEHDLVDREDSNIIIQMQLHQEQVGQDLKLVTRDSGFYPEKEAWNDNFPKISVEDIYD